MRPLRGGFVRDFTQRSSSLLLFDRPYRVIIEPAHGSMKAQ